MRKWWWDGSFSRKTLNSEEEEDSFHFLLFYEFSICQKQFLHFHFWARELFNFIKMASNSKKKSDKGLSPEEILNGFQTLRAEQRALSGKLSEFELDLNEHK